MKATLTRSGATGYSTANWKSYDVWGGERASTGSGSMFGYCGNLGHPTDPENGLIYMRARFYEPWTGRFLSEDPAKDGFNWYTYAGNAPSSNVDPSGESFEQSFTQLGYGVMGLGIMAIFASLLHLSRHNAPFMMVHAIASAVLGVTLVAIGSGMIGGIDKYEGAVLGFGGMGITALEAQAYLFYKKEIDTILNQFAATENKLPAGKAVLAAAAYSLVVIGFLFAIDLEGMLPE